MAKISKGIKLGFPEMVLLLSKNRKLSESLIKDLELEGFTIRLREKARDLILYLHQTPEIQMIILDLESMQKQANDIFSHLKKDEKLKYLPIICMIKKDLMIEQLISFELGAHDFIYIPYTTFELQLKMRSIRGLLNLQNQIKEKEARLKTLQQTQKILITLSHYINNSLTPLYSLTQTKGENHTVENYKQLRETAKSTVEFIQKVLLSLHNVVKVGEMKEIQKGIYKNLMLDIEGEIEKLQKNIQN